MPFLKADDIKEEGAFINDGEAVFVKAEDYVLCSPKLENDKFRFYVDGEYVIYDIGLFGSKVRNLYPDNTKCFLFQHPVRDDIDVDAEIGSGHATPLNKKEYLSLMQQLEDDGYVECQTMITGGSHYNTLLRQLRIERQMLLNRLLPEPSLSKVIEDESYRQEGHRERFY